jgi:hypothetical protein
VSLESLGLDGGRHKVEIIAIGFFFFLVLGSIGAIPRQFMFLDGGAAHTVNDEHPALGEKVSMVILLPLKENEPHDIGSILRELAEEGTLLHLMPNIVHDIQSLAASLVFLSAHKEIDKEPVFHHDWCSWG